MTDPPSAKRNAPREEETRGAERGSETTNRSKRNERAPHVKRALATIPLKTLTRTDDTALVLELMRPSRDVRLAFTARDASNPTRVLVLELMRPSRDVRLAFTARDASNPTRVHRPAFVVVRAAELDDVIAILVATRDANLKARGGV